VADILKIKPSRRNAEDFVAWQPEKGGIFSARSAYKMAFEEYLVAQGIGASSTRPAGERPVWRLIWHCPVPPKVRTLAWKIASNGLATEANMHRRGMETLPTCKICGTGPKETFHTFIICPPARDLWQAMRTIWDLPREDMIVPNGREWLLHLLAMLPEIQRAMVLMILWRIWHVHNEITHDKPMPQVEGSKRFLASYLDSLLMIKQEPNSDPVKGKMVLSYNHDHGSARGAKHTEKRHRDDAKWVAPSEGMAKLNTDGFVC
jgi:hypothetical protein